jgi:2-C-methyl-D-erythritol 4-phosphate cytidylyltransferase/2-C-methyl-D-erythritol 2,4-cyclodiphosphate synthase
VTELVAPRRDELRIRAIVAGGKRRQDSSANGIAAIPDDVDLVAVHDGARSLVTPALVSATIRAARHTGAACAALPCYQTMKRVERDAGAAEEHVIRGTVDRSCLWSAQTPQVFTRRRLAGYLGEAAHDGIEVTDETALFDMRGLPVRAVVGESSNIKITTHEDLAVAAAILRARSGADMSEPFADAPRVGIGYDIHRLVAGRRLVVCGVELQSDLGAEGHSDADVGAHAIIDALLGATASGDIGTLFPDTDAANKDADSMKLLAEVNARLRERGFRTESLDVTVFLARPAVAPHANDMRARLASACGVSAERIGIKAKTMNGLGPVGEGEAVAAQAAAVVRRG